jgi:methylmalonyl-CoA/ethylmalonyl-CoA epimerase
LSDGPGPMRLDHVAFAVWDIAKASRFWTEVMGGRYMQGDADWRGFAFVQFGFAGGSRVEVLSPGSDASGFVVKFLERFGEGVHHLTFVADDLRSQVAHVKAGGHAVFSEDYSDPQWMEAFFSLDLAGSRVLVQLAQTNVGVEELDAAWGTPLGKVLETAALRPDLR